MTIPTKPTILLSALLGYCAMWATRQSPYLAPDDLTKVLLVFKTRLHTQGYSDENYFSCFIPLDEIKDILKTLFLTIPEVRKWNERRNGNKCPYGCVSAFSKPEPDDDFIDLDALIMNIEQSCKKEEREYHDHSN